ncbi:hypothetical protein BHE74_00004812 [Ensete ventricosum]|nr:hypothetical protein BHE74_00004812 [Ensete ventricosum]
MAERFPRVGAEKGEDAPRSRARRPAVAAGAALLAHRRLHIPAEVASACIEGSFQVVPTMRCAWRHMQLVYCTWFYCIS